MQLTTQHQRSLQKRYHFENRALVYDADAPESFDMDKLNSYQPVSIAGHSSVTDMVAASLKTNSLFIAKTSVVEDLQEPGTPAHKKESCMAPGRFKNRCANWRPPRRGNLQSMHSYLRLY